MIDISKMDIGSLASLYSGIKDSKQINEKKLDELKAAQASDLEIAITEMKIAHDKGLMDAIQEKLKAEKPNFNRDYLHYTFGWKRTNIQIHFIPNSESHEKYGSHITGSIEMSEPDLQEMLDKKGGGQAHGRVKFNSIPTDKTREIREILKTEGFNSEDILKVY